MKPYSEPDLQVGEEVEVQPAYRSQFDIPKKDVVVAVNAKFVTLQSGKKFGASNWTEWGRAERISRESIVRWDQAYYEERMRDVANARRWAEAVGTLENTNWRHIHDTDWLHMMAECVKTKLAEKEGDE